MCRRVDGIPLALELAAARVPVLSVEQLADRLDDALRLLSTGSRVAPPRQQTLRATLEWSYRLLSEREQLLFRRLSVFGGGWTMEAADAVCAGDGIEREEVLDLLARLVDKSLVQSEIREDGSVRYRLLETLRQLGNELLIQAGETTRLRDHHLRWFLYEGERAAAKPSEWHRWFPWFYLELDNLRSARIWAIETRNAQEGLRMGTALRPFWMWGNGIYMGEGLATLEALLALPAAGAYPNCAGSMSRLSSGDHPCPRR